MSGYLFNKIQYKFFAEQLRQGLNRVKKNKSCEWIVDVHRLGKIEYGDWVYTEKERSAIIALVKSQLKVDLLHDDFPEDTSRIARANTFNEEKSRTVAVSHDFVLVNSLTILKLNQQTIEINAFQSLGFYVNANTVESVEHDCIVLVENLSVMANLSLLKFSAKCAFLKNALWVYRGDIRAQQTTAMAYQFFRGFKESHQLVCFADFDPKGLEIALTSGADYVITPTVDSIKAFQTDGADTDYFKQASSRNYIAEHLVDSSKIQQLFRLMSEQRRTIKQEHMLAKALTLSVSKIN
ncbi:hypothetical protein [Psychromonas sp. 14N.309.X.WAT.B.A12]|uniref:DUF7281 domain-containing protein n=1 Tax=unclassified Psychromonas TaxID=2614957 RepID=UPI0025AF00DF|nr:hypothetical protein [Psychromonas sp. 14N.309.X.WAT.B.A12]MDN2662089.1 hypothetical protein [Psychromonas sp. 14N.309.X.WAT.B.A12]